MNRSSPFSMLAGIVLLVVAAVQLLRIVKGWQVTVADASIPIWASWIAVLVAGFLGAMLLRDSRR